MCVYIYVHTHAHACAYTCVRIQWNIKIIIIISSFILEIMKQLKAPVAKPNCNWKPSKKSLNARAVGLK